MKRAVSISLGSSERDKAVEVELLGESVRIERRGTDGDAERATALFTELDGQVDALGVGGMKAREALWLATKGGAEVLGRNDLGSLEVGKRADFAVFDMTGLETSGAWDMVAALVLCAPLRARDTYVEGRPVVRDSRIVSFDLEAALRRHRDLAQGLMA